LRAVFGPGATDPAGFDEREFIIDPRGIQFKVYPMSEALAWIGGQTLEHSYRLMEVCTNPDGSILIPESVREWCLESMLAETPNEASALLQVAVSDVSF
jgi:hypothetical protein